MNFKFDDIKHLFDLQASDPEWTRLITNNYIGGVNALNTLKLWEWIRTYQPADGFCYSSSENVNKIMIKTERDGHSGTSFGYMMRGLQHAACVLIPEADCDKEVCAICLEEDYDEKIVLDCGHKYHKLCISHVVTFCPLCRGCTVPRYLKTKENDINMQ